jgi:AraC-like DNA-binding protein
MIKTIFNFVMLTGIVLGILFLIFSARSKNGGAKSIIYLNLFLLFLTLHNLQIWIIDCIYPEANFFVRNLLLPFYALVLPAFYTFIAHYLKVEKKIQSFVGFSIVLFSIEILVRIVFSFFYYNEKGNYVVAKYSQIEEIVNALFTLFLFVKSTVLVFRSTKLFASMLTYDSIKWLKTFLFIGSFVLLMWVSAIILNLDKVINPVIFIYYPLRLSSTVLVYWLGYQGFFNFGIMIERIEIRKIVSETPTKKTVYVPKNNTNNSIDATFELIQGQILDTARYLNPDFNLQTFSQEIELNATKISDSIKSATNSNFSDHINLMRVQKAKEYLSNPNYCYYTIEAIGFECGFNSKSAFYSSFKKFTNQTPTDYKQKNL